ncbi:carboxypeptidase-like regulatory domain-containing protein [Neolewinella lacunae]|uniref:Carboxypeptidase-like regulatory domain-containing protein n=1 Tax=Neolewinella lacunae TaxID=1517758 RepID=A0A923TCR9_9BACT|nr:carboxypeptidase-like regulatory domain-containing protein [Neolewinella lacunae]MBC6994032.1 carboxypeptidase-like regulatory domain-containing protein [Neolewinella lacunae]MDN3634702.1 carboxypeptidase-like regulatory domain-containing protein [Neolewinella lacunae]
MAWLFCAVAQGQGEGWRGSVVDLANGEPLPGATLSWVAGEHLLGGTTTDAAGEFYLAPPSPDFAEKCQLEVSFIGYRLLVLPHPELPSKEKELQLRLQDASNELAQVEISAEQVLAAGFRVEKLDPLEIYTNPIAKADPLLAVTASPSATNTDESAAVSLRGSSPNASSVFFEGVPLYGAVRFAQLEGIGTFSIFNTATLEDVQVFPSNPPLEFGNVAAGLISLQGSEQLPEQLYGGATLSLAGLGLNLAGATGQRGRFLVFGSYQPSDLLTQANPAALAQLPSFRAVDGGVYWHWRPDSVSNLKLLHYQLDESYRFLTEHPSNADLRFDQSRYRHSTVLSYRRRTGKNAYFSTALGWTRDRATFGGGNLNIASQGEDLYFSLAYRTLLGPWTWQTGLTADHRRLVAQGTVPAYDYALRPTDPVTEFTGTEILPLYEAYSFANRELGPHWRLGLGVRGQLPIGPAPRFLGGQVYGEWTPTNRQRVLFSAGNYRRLNPAGLVAPGEAQILSQQLAIDYEYRRKRWVYQAGLYHKQEQLKDRARTVWGAESGIDFRIPPKLTLSLAGTLLRVSGEQQEVRNFDAFDVPFFLRSTAQYQAPGGWTFGLSSIWRAGTLYSPLQAVRFNEALELYAPIFGPAEMPRRLPNYFLLNANVSKLIPLGESWSVLAFANLNNAFDYENPSGVAYNFDYTASRFELFSRRLLFLGVMVNWL